MTVKELIKKLKEFEDNTKVAFSDFHDGNYYKIDEVCLERVYKDKDRGCFSPSDGKGETLIVGIK